MENSIGLAEDIINQSHTTEGIIIEDVDAAASVLEHFSEFISPPEEPPPGPGDPDYQPGEGDLPYSTQ